MNLKLVLKRIAAYLIDIALLFAILAPAALLVERLLRITPQNAYQVWLAAVLSFSLPAWLYFCLSDQSKTGATLGKKILGVRVFSTKADRINLWRALARTAIKLLPWELAHIFGFGLAEQVSSQVQSAGLIASNALVIAYLAIFLVTGGKRSLHDILVHTEVGLQGKQSAQPANQSGWSQP